MSHEMFGIAVERVGAARLRARSIVGVSALAHAAAFAILLLVQLLAPGRLPMPAQRALAFQEEPRLVRLEDIVLPVPRRPVTPDRSLPSSSPPLAPPAASAPVEPPAGVGMENRAAGGLSAAGAAAALGIERGGGSLLEDVGVSAGPPAPPSPPPVRLHSGIRTPEKLIYVPPVYPEIARASHVQGVVIIEATIDAQGNVQAARVLKSIALLDRAALEAVRQWKFTPTLLNGTAVPIIMTVTVTFTLSR